MSTASEFDQPSKALFASIVDDTFPEGFHGKKGKVRDLYEDGERLILVSTDRLSAFDRSITTIPLKGRILNLLSAWWFDRTSSIVPNHVLSVPHPNITVAKRCQPFPLEFVVRGYMTGSTSTSLWTHYKKGEREYCGHSLPDGLKKGDSLPHPLLTPTTKDEHDELISGPEAIASGRISAADWEKASDIALRLFAYGSRTMAEAGYILADTKYEMGRNEAGEIVLIDEIHTPDSSRFWVADTFQDRIARGLEPENADKEFLRLWFTDRCDPYQDQDLPEAPEDLRWELSRRYARIYHSLTGKNVPLPDAGEPLSEALKGLLAPS